MQPLHISESSPSLHYGQQAFEGLKAYRTKDGSILHSHEQLPYKLLQTFLSELVASRDGHMSVADVWHFHQDGTAEYCHP